jgi:signal transduction histidine kinase
MARGDRPVASAPVSWPLVERRRSEPTSPPDGVERRGPRPLIEPLETPTLTAAPLWPFRLAALAGAIARAASNHDWSKSALIVAAVVTTGYTIMSIVRPVPYRNDTKIRLRIVVEQAMFTVVILVTGAWASPFALCLVPTGMLAGFAAGGLFSAQVAAASVAAITVQHVPAVGVRQGLQDGALWAGLLALVAFTSGLAHRAARDSVRQQQLAMDRVSMLTEANSLLFNLQRIAQTLPASLDLDDVLDSTVSRINAMVQYDALAVFLFDRGGTALPIRTEGFEQLVGYQRDEVPAGIEAAITSPKPIRAGFAAGDGVSGQAVSGLYAALRARGALVGLIALESNLPDHFGPQQVETLHGLTEPFGIAIDNARMFRQIRTLAADEERSRIARDLHDHIGSSLAMIGFEVDRASSIARDDDAIGPVLRELRAQVSAVVVDVRDTLYDLRSEVTDTKDLAVLLEDFLPRVERRSGIATTHRCRIEGRLPLMQEREIWQIVREAIGNAERHSQAATLSVTIHETQDSFTAVVRDDGIGLGKTTPRADSYGMVGMQERAARIGASIAVRAPSSGGTEIRVDMQHDEGGTRWDSQ